VCCSLSGRAYAVFDLTSAEALPPFYAVFKHIGGINNFSQKKFQKIKKSA